MKKSNKNKAFQAKAKFKSLCTNLFVKECVCVRGLKRIKFSVYRHFRYFYYYLVRWKKTENSIMKMNHVIVLQECNVSFCLLIEQMAVNLANRNYCTRTISFKPFKHT